MSWPSIRNVSSNIQHEDFSRKRWGGRSSFLSNAVRACCRVDWWLRLSSVRRDVEAFFQRGLSFAFAVEHFSKFWRFCSALGSARAGFWGSGRQKRGIYPVFCLLSDPHGPNLESQVDKNQTFPSVFVYFRFRALKQDLRAKPRSTKLLKGRLRLRAKCHFLRFARECRERRFKRHQVIVRCRQLCIL